MKTGRAFTKHGPRYFRVDQDGRRRWILNGRGMNPWDAGFNLLPLGDEVPSGAVLAPPVNATEVACVGLNYRAHAEECGVDWQTFKAPTFFGRALNSINSPNGNVVVPGSYLFKDKELGKPRFDYEVELVVVIGSPGYRIPVSRALKHVIGYMVGNDLSERQRQLDVCSQWLSGKCLPTSFPIGPVFVSADEVGDPQKLNLSLKVNGELRQSSTTADMIFSVAECVSALSYTRVLPAGLLISTGTPSGVVTKAKPELIVHDWLKPGDRMMLTIGNDSVDMGTQTQVCVEEDEGWLEFFGSGKPTFSRGTKFHS